MSLPQGTAIFAQIRNARSHSEQAAALRSLKNDITGHLQRKEKWVESGVLEPIVKILQTSRAPASQNGRDFRGAVAHARKLSDEEQVRLQALQLLAIFANGKSRPGIWLLIPSSPPPFPPGRVADGLAQADPRFYTRSKRPMRYLPFCPTYPPWTTLHRSSLPHYES